MRRVASVDGFKYCQKVVESSSDAGFQEVFLVRNSVAQTRQPFDLLTKYLM